MSFVNAVNVPLTTPNRNPQAIAFADINRDLRPDILIVADPTASNALLVYENKIALLSVNVTTSPRHRRYARVSMPHSPLQPQHPVPLLINGNSNLPRAHSATSPTEVIMPVQQRCKPHGDNYQCRCGRTISMCDHLRCCQCHHHACDPYYQCHSAGTHRHGSHRLLRHSGGHQRQWSQQWSVPLVHRANRRYSDYRWK